MSLQFAEQPSSDVIDKAAQLLAPRVQRAKLTDATLGEWIHAWRLPLNRLGDKENLRSIAKPLGHWCSLIYSGDSPVGQALIESPGGFAETTRLLDVSLGEAAKALYSGIDLLDKQEKVLSRLSKDDLLVRLLELPEYQLTALWVEVPGKEDLILVISVPESLSDLKTDKVEPVSRFRQLALEKQPIIGRKRE